MQLHRVQRLRQGPVPVEARKPSGEKGLAQAALLTFEWDSILARTRRTLARTLARRGRKLQPRGSRRFGSYGGAVADAVIDNPILNSPYEPPTRRWRFDDSGITDEVVEDRRTSGYFVPVPQARRQGAQLAIETEWTLDRLRPTRNADVAVTALMPLLSCWAASPRPNGARRGPDLQAKCLFACRLPTDLQRCLGPSRGTRRRRR